MTRFDILMPAFNAASTIAQSIESVLAQTLADWELWIVNDGSTDETSEVVRPFLGDARIHLIEQENRRLGAARNAGLRAGRAPYVCFLDSDDLWMPDKLEKQSRAHIASGATVTFSDGEIFWDGDGAPRGVFATPRGDFSGAEMLGKLLMQNQLPVLSVSVRREALEEVGGFEQSAAFHGVEDYDLWIRLAEAGASFHGMDEFLVRYRRHANAMTAARTPHVLLREIEVWKRHFALAQSVGLGAELAAKIHLHYHGVALKMVEAGEIGAARRLISSAQVRRWERGAGLVKRAGLRLAPRVYTKIYAGLSQVKARWR